MTCKKCGTDNGTCKKTCINCGACLEGYTFNNVTGEYGYRGSDGYFYHSEEEYKNRNLDNEQSGKKESKL